MVEIVSQASLVHLSVPFCPAKEDKITEIWKEGKQLSKKSILTSSSTIIPSMLMEGSAALGFIFLESQSLVRRPKTLQFCWPKLMSSSFMVAVMSKVLLKEYDKVASENEKSA